MFKDVYKYALGENAAKYQTFGFLAASACAEVIADVLLCPFEAVRYQFFVSKRELII
jgi:solute carrier family 25 phosphate transporter 3